MGFEDLTDPVNRAVSATLGIPATWTPKGGGSPVDLRAVFRRTHTIFDELGTPVETRMSSAHVRALDLTRLPIEDDGFEIDGRAYLISAIEPDGQGGITLVLVKAPDP